MNAADKRFARMKRNPFNDWTIDDVRVVCARYDVACMPPSAGSHYKVSHPSQIEILTVPAHKPIKPVYIVQLVTFIESVIESES